MDIFNVEISRINVNRKCMHGDEVSRRQFHVLAEFLSYVSQS